LIYNNIEIGEKGFSQMKYLLFISLFSTALVHAQTNQLEFEDWNMPELITSARGLAMGNAFISKVDDEYAAFYNPAGLGTRRKSKISIINFHIESNKNILSRSNDTQFLDYFDSEGMRQLVDANKNTLVHNRFSFFPNVTMRFLTLGYFISKQYRAYQGSNPGDKFLFSDRLDYGPILSTNLSFWGGIFKLGASVAYVNRKEFLNDPLTGEHPDGSTGDLIVTTPMDQQINEDTDYFEGAATIITVGGKLTLPTAWLPTFSGVIRNSSAQKFTRARGLGAPNPIEQTVDVGFSFTPITGKGSSLHFEFNWKDVTDKYGKIFEKRAMAGMEWNINRRLFLRYGYGDGYGSGGIGYQARTYLFDLTTYATDRDPDRFRISEERRWILSISSGF
jgi:hypothetical protein